MIEQQFKSKGLERSGSLYASANGGQMASLLSLDIQTDYRKKNRDIQ